MDPNTPQYPPQQYNLPEEEGIDIKKYIFLILSHWWWFAITIFMALSIAYLVNRYSQQMYSASCSIIIGEPQSSGAGIENILDELSRVKNKRRKAVVENEISILKSYTLARLALEELDFNISYTAVGRRNIAESQLYKNCPFIVIYDSTNIPPPGSYNITILSESKYKISIGDIFEQELLFGKIFKKDNIEFKLLLRDPENFIYNSQLSNKYYFTFINLNTLANSYRSALAVEVNDEKGSILTLTLNGYVPDRIIDYLNKLSEVYIRSNLEEKNITSINTIKFIDEQLQGIVDSLETTGLKLQQFRSANKVINLSKEGTYLFEKLQDLQSEKALLDISARYYQYLLEYIEEKTDFSDVVAPSVVGIQDQLLNNLVAQLNELNLQRRNLSLTVVDNSPQLAIINNQIINTRNALEENLRSLIEANSISDNELNERILKFEKEVQKLPGTERQLINIEREFTINDQIYTFLLEKRAEAGITKASNTSDHKILDTAKSENVSLIKPKASMNYMMALVIGSLLPLMLILIIEYFNNKINSRKDIENNTNIPILGSIGHNNTQSELSVIENPKSALAESFRGLRANLQFLMKDKGRKVIAISSTISGEGKTFTALNLAAIMAMAGKKTVVIGLDLRRPKIHRVFNLKNDMGLSTYLIGKSKEEEIIHQTTIDNLFAINSGPIPPNPAELIGSDQLSNLIQKLKKYFDNIIIDTPPMAIVSDALLLQELTDTYLFVVRQNFSNKNVVQLLDNLYNKKELKNMYILVNDVQVKGYYGYNYYGYDYGYGYEYYGKGYYDDDENLTRKLRIHKLMKRFFR